MQASRLTRHRRMAASRPASVRPPGKRLSVTSIFSAQCQNFEIGIVRGRARRLVGDQQLHHHLLRRDLARARSDFTFMPTLGVRLQDAASTRSPSISTMQARQLPSGR